MAKKNKLLVDITPVSLQLVESEGDGRTVVRGEFARAGSATENKRVYPGKIWEQEMKRLDRAMEERRVFGEIDHPNDGKTSLQRVSHIVTGLKLQDGILIGEAEVLPTEKGKILEALLKSGCKVGVSSRGYGSVRSNDKGEDIVQSDYKLTTFDFVAEPADTNAYPEVFFESVGDSKEILFEGADVAPEIDDSDIKAHSKEDAKKAKQWEKILRDEKAAEEAVSVEDKDTKKEAVSVDQDNTSYTVENLINVVKDLVKSEQLNDSIKASIEEKDSIIEQLKSDLTEKDSKIESLESDLMDLAVTAKETGYLYYIEKTLSGDPDSDLIKNVLGEVSNYQSADELKDRLQSIKDELSVKREKEQKAAEEAARVRADMEKLQEDLEVRAVKAEEEAMRLAKLNKKLALRLKAESVLKDNPRSTKILKLLENSKVDNEDDLREFIDDQVKSYPHDIDEAADIRSRIRQRIKSRSVESNYSDEEKPQKSPNFMEDISGLNIRQLKELSGIKGAQ